MESYYFQYGDMSKIGEKSISIPSSVQIEIKDKTVSVKGKAGELAITIPKGLLIEREGDLIKIKRESEQKSLKALHGLYRSLVLNAVVGVEVPWVKKLEVVGTGFNLKLQGEDLVFKVGYSHPVVFKKIDGVKYLVEGNNKVTVSGIDKQLVGQTAYKIKQIRKPDVYKGKGVRYEGEKIRLKPGKKAKTTA